MSDIRYNYIFNIFVSLLTKKNLGICIDKSLEKWKEKQIKLVGKWDNMIENKK